MYTHIYIYITKSYILNDVGVEVWSKLRPNFDTPIVETSTKLRPNFDTPSVEVWSKFARYDIYCKFNKMFTKLRHQTSTPQVSKLRPNFDQTSTPPVSKFGRSLLDISMT